MQSREKLLSVVDPSERVRVDNDAGSIEVGAWERDEVEVVAEKHAPDQAGLDLIKVFLTSGPGGARVGYTAPQPLQDTWVDFTIRCPRRTPLDLHNISGEILLSGFQGPSRAATVSGAIRAARMQGTATLTSSSGDIDGAALEGTVHARSASGRVSLRGELTGSHRVETASGDIDIEGVDGCIDARSTSGNLTVEGRLTGASALETVSGSINVRLLPGSQLPPGGLPARSVSGQVEVIEVGE
ncbi:MAG: DUF4097 family beta strand repeat-containing protein [Candidatus Dormibacteria bacterium]